MTGRDPGGPSNPSPAAPLTELAHLSWPEVERRIADDPRLLLGVGSLEQHGPHLPLGTSILIADRVVREASRTTGVLRAPTLHYGVGAPTKRVFPGAASLQRKTLHRTLNEILAAWEDAGIRELVIVTANHYEPHLDALLMALTSESVTTVVDLRSIPATDILEGDPISEHGGELETSLLLHLAPGMVRRGEIADFVPDARTFRKYVRGRRPTPPPESDGVVGRPTLASREKGQRLFRRYVEVLRQQILAAGPSNEGRALVEPEPWDEAEDANPAAGEG